MKLKQKRLFELQKSIFSHLESYPKRINSRLSIWGFVKYNSIAFIDDKGDVFHNYPHLYLEKANNNLFFDQYTFIVESSGTQHQVDRSNYNRIKAFPEVYNPKKVGKFHTENRIVVTNAFLKEALEKSVMALLSKNDAYSFWQAGDTIRMGLTDNANADIVIRLRVKYIQSVNEYLQTNYGGHEIRRHIKDQLGTSISHDEPIYVYEFSKINSELMEE